MRVEGLYQYPLLGARAVSKPSFEVVAGGILNDRRFLLYDADRDPMVEKTLVDQREITGLADVSAQLAAEGLRVVMKGEFHAIDVDSRGNQTVVNQGGGMVPVVDMGDEAASLFNETFSRPGRGPTLRLAQKTINWVKAGPGAVSERTEAPFHIITRATIEEMQRRGEGYSLDPLRSFPNIIVSGDVEPFTELTWLDRSIRVDETTLLINRIAHDASEASDEQARSEEAFKLFPEVEHHGKLVLGVCGYALIRVGQVHTIRRGAEVRLDS